MGDEYAKAEDATLEPILSEEEQKLKDEEDAKIVKKEEPLKATSYLLEKPDKSSNGLYVYTYDLELNRFKPYKMDSIKKSEDFPSADLNRMLDEMADHGRPPKIERILWVLGFSFLLTIAYILVVEIIEFLDGHNKALHILLWTIAVAPVGLTCVMVLIGCIAYMTVLGRRNSLNLTAELRNRELFNPLGINVVFSQSYEWFCIEIRN